MIDWAVPVCPQCGAEGIVGARLFGEVLSMLLEVTCRCGKQLRLEGNQDKTKTEAEEGPATREDAGTTPETGSSVAPPPQPILKNVPFLYRLRERQRLQEGGD